MNYSKYFFERHGGRVISDSNNGPSISIDELYEMFRARLGEERLDDIEERLNHLELRLDALEDSA